MSLFRWVAGRQGTGYRKMLLAAGKAWDCYLLDYPPGTFIPFHRDPVPGKAHWRLNVTLLGNHRRLVFGRTPATSLPWRERGWWKRGRVTLFRSDLVEHAVLKGMGRRVVVSIGWVRP